MKYYESNFDEYLLSISKYNLHEELDEKIKTAPLQNTIFYGPSGVGKYSQCLHYIHHCTKSTLKYDKKICVYNEKAEKKPKPDKKSKTINITKKADFVYKISDVHYEVDMAILGCNSKTLWYDIFFQIVDIISLKPNKMGIIVCKNFHHIYSELLDVFYSYIRHPFYNIKVYFILLTEHLSFISNSILNSFHIVPVKRPNETQYKTILKHQKKTHLGNNNGFIMTQQEKKTLDVNFDAITSESIVNAKEVNLLKRTLELPNDIFNIVTDVIISKILNPQTINIQLFRNDIYDLLIYNTDITEVLHYIIQYLIQNELLNQSQVHDILHKTFTFLKHFNNNYRPIYHLESIIYYIIYIIHFKKE